MKFKVKKTKAKDATKQDAAKGKGAAPDKGGGTQDKDQLAQEAIKNILEGIKQSDVQKKGQTFIPADWHTKYKSALGAYRKFLTKHPDKLRIQDMERGGFIVCSADDPSAPPPAQAKAWSWKKELDKAWSMYCDATAKEERNVANFISALPKTVRVAKAGEGAGSPDGEQQEDAAGEEPAEGKKKKKKAAKADPSTSPKASPATAPADAPAVKKVKKKVSKS